MTKSLERHEVFSRYQNNVITHIIYKHQGCSKKKSAPHHRRQFFLSHRVVDETISIAEEDMSVAGCGFFVRNSSDAIYPPA